MRGLCGSAAGQINISRPIMKILQQLKGLHGYAADCMERIFHRHPERQFLCGRLLSAAAAPGMAANGMKMKFGQARILLAAVVLGMLSGSLNSCRTAADPEDFTKDEIELIRMYSSAGLSQKSHDITTDGEAGTADGEVPSGTMRVLTIEDSCDNAVLRDTSRNLSVKALLSDEYDMLAKLMVATVTHPTQDGVGIAGPQVGLNRRVVAVQRFDKGTSGPDGNETYPFEVYPNIRIVWASDSLAAGPEGCLSVPDRRGEVLRSQEIVIEYTDMEALLFHQSQSKRQTGWKHSESTDTSLPTRRDTVKGFTAVIFQHETDHLDGVLYIDRL